MYSDIGFNEWMNDQTVYNPTICQMYTLTVTGNPPLIDGLGVPNDAYSGCTIFNVGQGGTWEHYHDQNPPRVFHNYNDMANKYTPRSLDAEDINDFGYHFMVYDLDTQKVVEFASGLSYEWSDRGDKQNERLF